MSNLQTQRLEWAEDAIEIREQIEILQQSLDEILEEMLETSGGQSFTVAVPGKASVQVVRATEGGIPQGVFAPMFDVKKYNKLSEQRKKALAKDGVVVVKEKISYPRKASIRVKFNV